jgi:sensor c-di-GMP phosphodiesterase-like protein
MSRRHGPAPTRTLCLSWPLRRLRQRDPVSPQRRKRYLAILIGVALAGVPIAAFHLWMGWFIEQRGREEVDRMAKRSLALAEYRAGLIVRTLTDLSHSGIDNCDPAAIEAMRTAKFWATPIKEFSIVDAAGQTLCSELGASIGPRSVLSIDPLSADGSSTVEVVRFGERHRHAMIRIRLAEAGKAGTLAAMAPAELFVPIASMPASAGGSAIVSLSTRDGHRLSEGGARRQGESGDRDLFVATVASERNNFVAEASLPRERVLANYSKLHAAGTVVSGVTALIIVGLAFVLPLRRRKDPIAELERAIAAGELVPFFQPLVDIVSGKLRGAEVLLRWRKADGSLALPAMFVPLLESSGLIIEVTRMLMRRVRDELGPAYGQRPRLKINFNLAAAHFADETIVNDVREIFENSKIRFNQIMLEVTERQPIENLTETRRVIAALQGLGVGIAIDDVGSGHSGLSYMLKLGVDAIKIDKMFVDAIGTDRTSVTIIDTLIELARNLRMEIVAEGVETFEQVVALRDLGVRVAQGYVFAPPLPLSSFLQLIEAIDPLPQPALVPAKPGATAGDRIAAA